MTQHRPNSTGNDKWLRHELYALLQEGLNKTGDSNHSHFNQENQELLVYSNDLSMSERVGLYY